MGGKRIGEYSRIIGWFLGNIDSKLQIFLALKSRNYFLDITETVQAWKERYTLIEQSPTLIKQLCTLIEGWFSLIEHSPLLQ